MTPSPISTHPNDPSDPGCLPMQHMSPKSQAPKIGPYFGGSIFKGQVLHPIWMSSPKLQRPMPNSEDQRPTQKTNAQLCRLPSKAETPCPNLGDNRATGKIDDPANGQHPELGQSSLNDGLHLGQPTLGRPSPNSGHLPCDLGQLPYSNLKHQLSWNELREKR